MSNGNGDTRAPVEIYATRMAPAGLPRALYELPEARRRQSTIIALALFVFTLLSTLAAGTQFAVEYAQNRPPSLDGFFEAYAKIWHEPRLLLAGLPFSFTLIGILLAHELGHYFACRYYSISASYPYFIPAPTLIGTLGAFIRIRSPIVNRKALFDVGLAGPLVGFVFALPALAVAIASSKVVPGARAEDALIFGQPLLARMFMAVLRPGVAPGDLLLHPVGRAAWVGLFATALNLLPAGQLDGGHLLYALASENHRRVSLLVALGLAPLAIFCWAGWLPWAVLLLLIGFRHPPLLNRWDRLDQRRWIWAGIALVIFLLCFTPWPFHGQSLLDLYREIAAGA